MTNYEQVAECNINQMGKQMGFCLQNCRVAFGFKIGKKASAKVDYQNQLQRGLIHPLNTLPKNVCVSVYADTPAKLRSNGKYVDYDHVMISYYGQLYSDGKKVNWNYCKKYYGWGEEIDGYRIVKPTTLKQFLPAKGYWQYGDQDERIDFLTTFLYATFPAYAKRNVLGNIYGKNTVKAIKEFQRRTGLYVDGILGKNTYAMLKKYGFNY